MDKLSMSLDDMIKSNVKVKKNKTPVGKKATGGAAKKIAANKVKPVKKVATPKKPGVSRPVIAKPRAKAGAKVVARIAPAVAKAVARQPLALTTGTRVKVANLGNDVSAEDIKQLFSEMGELKSHELLTHPNGKSKGVAFVVYKKRADAENVVAKYNGVPLDGRPLKLSINTATILSKSDAMSPKSITVTATKTSRVVANGRPVIAAPRTAPAGRGGRGRGSNNGGRGQKKGKGGRVQGQSQTKSSMDLDAELDSYHANA